MMIGWPIVCFVSVCVCIYEIASYTVFYVCVHLLNCI